MIRTCFAFFVAFSICNALATAKLVDELSSEQLQTLKGGQLVKKIEDVADNTWPRVTIYQTVRATPEEVMAVFIDYVNAKEFTPDVISSEIAKVISPKVKEVDYVVKVPLLANESYAVRNTLTSLGDASYRVSWTMLRSTYMKSGTGDFTVEPFNGGTLMRHTSLTEPGSKLVAPLKGFALTQVEKTVASLKNYIEKMKSSQPQKLNDLVSQLNAALK